MDDIALSLKCFFFYLSSTVIVARKELFSLISVPGQNLDKIRDKRRHDALEYCTVAANCVLFVDVRVVVLRNDYNEQNSCI